MINNFINERFPEDISFGAIGGPEYKTSIVITYNGKEQRGINWSMPKLKYNVAYGIKNQEQMENLLAFFRIVKGRAIGFRFKDWSDYQATEVIIGHGNKIQKSFQLTKKYQRGRFHDIRLITKPIEKTLVIKINNQIVSSENYQVDYNKGIVNFFIAPKDLDIVKATFEFDVPVRFDIDYLPVTIEDMNLYSCYGINLLEVRV